MQLESPLITTERLLLNIGNEESIPAIIQYYTQNKTFLTPFYPLWTENFFTLKYWQHQVDMDLYDFIHHSSLNLFIYKKANPNQIIGTSNFRNFVKGAAHYCTLGYSLAENEQGKGYMTEALQSAILYVFQELNMHRIMANYMPHNQRSGNLLKRLGFVVEGYARDYLLINGKWEDHILTSLVNPHWQYPKY
ncbi:MAG: ribosomal protein S5-alanine N-acetyltransferase [Nostocaceae cyanobacterium]|nr:ribosomal protein S5-alanine N-acetyltransferase [Nostocaceae cyanobacterium]